MHGTPLSSIVQPDVLQIGLVLALSLFVGLEREEHKQRGGRHAFGGVTTFPIIGLVSYALARVSDASLVPWTVGLAAVSAFTLVSYRHKLAGEPPAEVTTEMSAIAIYAVAALVRRQHYWIATTVGVLTVLILELKKTLDDLTRRVVADEIVTVAKFLVLAAVILPIVPDRPLTPFHINPFSTWLVVVAVSGISFGSYVLQRVLDGRGGLMLSAVLGGAYSSTATTVALAREARDAGQPSRFAGATLTASAVMYVRLVILIAFFNRRLAVALAPSFCVLAAVAGLVGFAVYRRADGRAAELARPGPKNPLELRAAFFFGAVFVAVLVVTHLVREHLGKTGLLTLACVMGVTDVDPFILGLTQTSASFADRATGRLCLVLLGALAAAGARAGWRERESTWSPSRIGSPVVEGARPRLSVDAGIAFESPMSRRTGFDPARRAARAPRSARWRDGNRGAPRDARAGPTVGEAEARRDDLAGSRRRIDRQEKRRAVRRRRRLHRRRGRVRPVASFGNGLLHRLVAAPCFGLAGGCRGLRGDPGSEFAGRSEHAAIALLLQPVRGTRRGPERRARRQRGPFP